MKFENITADDLVKISKDHTQFKELVADLDALEMAVKIRTNDGWDIFMLAALYQTSARYIDLISAVNSNVLNLAMSNMSDQCDHLLFITLRYQGVENFKLLENNISQTVLGASLLLLAQQAMPEEFHQITAAIGLENSNTLMLNALAPQSSWVASRSSAIKLLGCNISLAALVKKTENSDDKYFEILNGLSSAKLCEFLRLISGKPVDLLTKTLNGINQHSLAKAVLISEDGNNFIMSLMQDKKNSTAICFWLDFLASLNILNKAAVKINQSNENLVIIALRYQDNSLVTKIISLVHLTVSQKTLISFLVRGDLAMFDKFWSLFDDKLKVKVLINAANQASAKDLEVFVNKIINLMIGILSDVSDDDFILLIKKIEPLQLSNILLNSKDNKEKLIKRWTQLSKETLLAVLKIKNDNNSSVMMCLTKSLIASEFTALVNGLSEIGRLNEVCIQRNKFDQDVLMFAANCQDANSFLILAKAVQKENKLNELAKYKDSGNYTALALLAQKQPFQIFALFLAMLDSEVLKTNVQMFFSNIRNVNFELDDKKEKSAIAHLFNIHHLLSSQIHEDTVEPENILEINKSRSSLNGLSFPLMSQLLVTYEESFTNLPASEMEQCKNTIVKVKQTLSTPYIADSAESEGALSGLYAWLSGASDKGKNNTNNNSMVDMNKKNFK